MSNGWIYLHRSIWETDFWDAEKFTYGQAWIDLILMANYEKRSVCIRGNIIAVERGQLARSEESLATRWKWSRGKVGRYLKMLKTRGMIVQQTVQQNKFLITITSIVNYNKYQKVVQQTEQQVVQQTEQQTDSRQYRNKEVKEKKEIIIPDKLKNESFLKAWSEWKKYRAERKLTMTDRTQTMQLLMLSKQADPVAVINQSIMNGWTGLFDLKAKSNVTQQPSTILTYMQTPVKK